MNPVMSGLKFAVFICVLLPHVLLALSLKVIVGVSMRVPPIRNMKSPAAAVTPVNDTDCVEPFASPISVGVPQRLVAACFLPMMFECTGSMSDHVFVATMKCSISDSGRLKIKVHATLPMNCEVLPTAPSCPIPSVAPAAPTAAWLAVVSPVACRNPFSYNLGKLAVVEVGLEGEQPRVTYVPLQSAFPCTDCDPPLPDMLAVDTPVEPQTPTRAAFDTPEVLMLTAEVDPIDVDDAVAFTLATTLNPLPTKFAPSCINPPELCPDAEKLKARPSSVLSTVKAPAAVSICLGPVRPINNCGLLGPQITAPMHPMFMASSERRYPRPERRPAGRRILPSDIGGPPRNARADDMTD